MKKPPAKRSPNQQNNQRSETREVSVQSAMWAAPLPPPNVLQDYDHIVEHGAERIVRAWEIEGQHRREQENRDQRWFWLNAIIGKIFALVFVLSALAATGYAIHMNQPWLAGVLGGTTLAIVVGAFIEVQKHK
jgi:Predicted membrane protein